MANSISGKAAAGALVTLSGTASATTYANLLGQYTFSGLAAGPYVITPTKQGLRFSPASSSQIIVAVDITGVNFLASSAGQAASTFTVQNMVDKVSGFPLISPIFNVAGYTSEPSLTIATDVMNAILATPFPHKWNEVSLPLFYTFSWQQDYALINPDGTSVYNVEWLEQGVAFDINNSGIPKPFCTVECGRSLPQRTGGILNTSTEMNDPGFVVSSLPNESLYYGTWGQANTGGTTLGNNPVAGSVYQPFLGNISMPANPIAQIRDANGNLLVLTTLGTEGSSAPLLPANSAAGTTVSGLGATTVWTVVDPIGLGIRILDVPSSTGVVWQFNLVGQMPPFVFTSLQQTLSPLPDKYEPFFRAGFIAQCYRYSPEKNIRAKFQDEWTLWLKSLSDMRVAQDRELEEYSFVADRTVMGSARSRNNFVGAAWPFNYPRL